MIYKVTAQGSLREINIALHDAFFGQYNITHISRPDRNKKVTIEVLSPVSITCVVEPITGIELKIK
jgi:hypothetical protein